MSSSADLIASLALAVAAAVLLLAHRFAGAPAGFERVTRQGATPFLARRLMDAGYWMLQPVVRSCVRRRLSPTFLSWLSLLPAGAAAVAAGLGHWGASAWCLLASALLDVLDGAVARAGCTVSAAGAVLDSALDRYAESFFFLGALVFYQQQLAAQILVCVAWMGSFLITYSTAKAEALQLTPPRGWMKRSDRLALLIIGAGLTPVTQRWFDLPQEELAWPALAAIGVIAVLANGSAVRRFAALARDART